MPKRKQFAIAVWLLLIGGFTPPPLLRGDDQCRLVLPSRKVQNAALFYELVGNLLVKFMHSQSFSNSPLVFGDLLLDDLQYRIDRVRGMACNTYQATQWEETVLKYNVVQHLYFLASQALEFREAYATIHAENYFQTPTAHQQLISENVLEIMHDVHNQFPRPVVRSKTLAYELLVIAELPYMAFLRFNASKHPEIFLELKYRHTSFIYEPSVPERPSVIGYFRTPIDCRPDLNMQNEYALLLRALNSLAHEFDALENCSKSLTYSDKFLAIVSPKALAYAQTTIRELFVNSTLSAVVEYQLIATTFLRGLLNFLIHQYDWLRCHPAIKDAPSLMHAQLWQQVDNLLEKSVMIYALAYESYVKSRHMQREVDDLYVSLHKRNFRVGFTLRTDLGVGIGDDSLMIRRTTFLNITTTRAPAAFATNSSTTF